MSDVHARAIVRPGLVLGIRKGRRACSTAATIQELRRAHDHSRLFNRPSIRPPLRHRNRFKEMYASSFYESVK